MLRFGIESATELFVDVDDFWISFRSDYEKRLIADGQRYRHREGQLSTSEIMTILISFQDSHHRDFEHFYLHLQRYHHREFPEMPSYNRFVTLMPRVMMPLFAYLITRCLGTVTGISFIDSTAIKVCGNKRIKRNRIFDGLAAIGKSTLG